MVYFKSFFLQMISEKRKQRVSLLFIYRVCLKLSLNSEWWLLFSGSHLQMNYMFLKQRVESRPFASIQQQHLDSIVSRIPTKLKESHHQKNLLQELCMEVSKDFHNVIVKHTGIEKYTYFYL